ncbi:hypothetical protein BMW23_0742 [Bodo saltans virus]|uniref:Uncharacterized protein n=1 Tax=Bodo saltans virus TaxID=2024608 RepID=A0A2H4UV41_9VIRU|nr:hypothetical protein QJ851_gp0725 [Bodo saltans virus]ATZ80788.1 hypothetical protein BMW23_0742 [Bodo saltans virus]
MQTNILHNDTIIIDKLLQKLRKIGYYSYFEIDEIFYFQAKDMRILQKQLLNILTNS